MPVKVKREEAVKMFVDLGMDKAPSWNNKRLINKVKDLKEAINEGGDLHDAYNNASEETKDLASSYAKGKDFIIVETGPNPTKKGGDKDDKPSKKDKPAKKDKPSTDDEATSKDSFGSREGSEQSLVNKVLSKKPQKMKDLAEKAGLAGKTFYNHLNDLVGKGLVVKSPEGYSIA